ncbi:DUF2892 domain-containing protein [Candidatus Woesearchaeota archaeon]|nr:DUF2892 domain-containing protein [Candidatus Woesearchaeota archaeon]
MKQNLGRTDRILRFALAFWWLGPWPLRFDIALLDWAIIIVAWIALFESFFGYCWLHDLFGMHSKGQ